MRDWTRREWGAAFVAAACGGLIADAQTTPKESGGETLAHSEIFAFADLTPKSGENGMVSRPVTRGTLLTGEFVEAHETTLPPGQMPHPPHRHTHSEFLLIREGTLSVTSDGKTGVVGTGGVVFTTSGVLHSLKNVGDVAANYFVVGIGVQRAIG